MRKFGFSSALIAVAASLGGIAGFNPGDPYRFVPIAGKRSIGRDLLKPSRNSIRYPEPHKIGGRQQKRFARQLAAGKLSFFDHDANRAMILKRSINHPAVEIANYRKIGLSSEYGSFDRHTGTGTSVEKIERTALGDGDRFVDDKARAILSNLSRGEAPPACKSRDRIRDLGLIAYERATRSWIVTDAGYAALNKG